MKTQTATVTKKTLIVFHVNSQNYLMGNPRNKLTYAIEKVIKANEKLVQDYYDSIEEINIDLASVDEKQNIIYTDVQNNVYALTKENKKEQLKRVRTLNDESIEVKTFTVTEENVPTDLPRDFKAIFTPFVIEEVASDE